MSDAHACASVLVRASVPSRLPSPPRSSFENRSGLPRHDVDPRYSGHPVTSSSACSEINSSGKVLSVSLPPPLPSASFNLHLSLSLALDRGAPFPPSASDYCVTDRHQPRKLGVANFVLHGVVGRNACYADRPGSLIGESWPSPTTDVCVPVIKTINTGVDSWQTVARPCATFRITDSVANSSGRYSMSVKPGIL